MIENKNIINLPSINKVLQSRALSDYKAKLKAHVLKKIVQNTISSLRDELLNNKVVYSEEEILIIIIERINSILKPTLKEVINATGIVLHTNLGRAPLGQKMLDAIAPIVRGYNNLEFDLGKGKRGSRNSHLSELIKLLFDCEDSIVVNNNAAAVFLALKCFAARKEVIVSRGELVEIGGSFRIPDIIKTSGCKMKEVGTTNKTHLYDYSNVCNEKTAVLLKVHRSNYHITGFTAEVTPAELVKLGHEKNIMTMFDLGTGLVDKKLIMRDDKSVNDEPDVKEAIAAGFDLVTFSCDKLLGGPQAGIIVGKKEYIKKLSSHPLMRVLRVDKLTISALNFVLMNMLFKEEVICQNIPIFSHLIQDNDTLKKRADKLSIMLTKIGFAASIEPNIAYFGGGTLPDHQISSWCVMVKPEKINDTAYAEKWHKLLMKQEPAIVSILREGKLYFDILMLNDEQIGIIGNSLNQITAKE